MKRVLLLSILSLTTTALFSQTKIGGKIDVNSGYVKLEEKDIWETMGNASVSVNSSISNSIKAYLDGGISVMTLPETDLTTAGFLATVTLNKAYFKMRFPIGENNSLRLNIGKQSFSMGYGLYYNAGDLIFGADPNKVSRSDTSFSFSNIQIRPEVAPVLATMGITNVDQAIENFLSKSEDSDFSGVSLDSGSLSDLRVLTDWILNMQFSFNDKVSIDVLALPPIDTTLNSKYGRFGGKVTYRADAGFLESMEAGVLSQGNLKKIQTYAAFDGTLWLDYNLCSSITFDTPTKQSNQKGNSITAPEQSAQSDDTTSDSVEFNKDLWNISLGLCKIFSIQTDTVNHNLTTRIEALYYPIAESLNIFTYLSYDITDKINCSAYYLFASPKLSESEQNTHSIGANISYSPLSNFSISFTGMIRVDDPKELSAILLGAKVSF